jgi:thymidylate synthase
MEPQQKRHPEYQYLDLLRDIMDNGFDKIEYSTRNTTHKKRRGVFGRIMRFDLSKDFPLLTTKKVFMKGILHELLWFLKGGTNIKPLVDNDVHIWDEWAYKEYAKAAERGEVPNLSPGEFAQKVKESPADSDFVRKYGELGPVYGRQWRKWKASDGRTLDQLGWAIDGIKREPYRNHFVVSAWNPENVYEMSAPGSTMAIPPCHTLFHLDVLDDKLHLLLYQRSCDTFLGVPFNIASYATLTKMIAQVNGLPPGDFVHVLGDVHVYSDHFEQVKEQLAREPRPFPTLRINPAKKSIDDFVFEDFTLENYNPHLPIKAPITAVGGFDEKQRGKWG